MVCYISLPFSLPLMKIPNTYSTTMYPDLMNMTKNEIQLLFAFPFTSLKKQTETLFRLIYYERKTQF